MVLKIPLIPVYPHGHIRLSFIQLTDTAQQNAGLGTSIGTGDICFNWLATVCWSFCTGHCCCPNNLLALYCMIIYGQDITT